MSSRLGICKNLPDCTKAVQAERMRVPRELFVCPECGWELKAYPGGNLIINRLAVGLVGLMLLVSVSLVAYRQFPSRPMALQTAPLGPMEANRKTQSSAPNPSPAVVPALQPLPPRYARLTQGAEHRLDLLFDTNSSILDGRTLDELGRFLQFMNSHEEQNKEVLLFGFADSEGGDLLNNQLSKQRALVVARGLVEHQIHPSVVEGFGQQFPVTSNDTEEGRRKNRRVEVWLRRRDQ